MNEQKHTPGPWRIIDGRRERALTVVAGGRENTVICDTAVQWSADAGDRGAANARLIASAPALLDALRGMQDWIDWYARDDESGMTSRCVVCGGTVPAHAPDYPCGVVNDAIRMATEGTSND
jgi:hypothetical protein